MIASIRAFFRFNIFAFTASAFLLVLFSAALFTGRNMNRALRIRQVWANWCSRWIGVQIEEASFTPPEGPVVYISNHRSYFDPVAALRHIKALPVAKAEVSSWPFIGFAAEATGVMWVKRENKDSRRATMDTMAEWLEKGFSVLIYPEGTTHIDPTSMEFRHGAFKLAAKLGVPVFPMAIEYSREEDAWVGDATFIPHFFEAFGKRHMRIKMRYGQLIQSDDYQELHDRTKAWIDQQMVEMRAEFNA